jgi:hypothetical protein
MQSITGLAILRHTGLGYLVIQVVEDAFSLDAFQIFNLFREKQFAKTGSPLHTRSFVFMLKVLKGTDSSCLVMSTPQVDIPLRFQGTGTSPPPRYPASDGCPR